MNPIDAIGTALIAGATAGASGIAKDSVVETYSRLRNALVAGYKFVSASLLDTDPKDPDFQNAVRAELKKNPSIASDAIVLEAAQALSSHIESEGSEMLVAWGVDIDTIEAASSVIIERLSGTAGGLRVKTLRAPDIRISDVKGGSSQAGK